MGLSMQFCNFAIKVTARILKKTKEGVGRSRFKCQATTAHWQKQVKGDRLMPLFLLHKIQILHTWPSTLLHSATLQQKKKKQQPDTTREIFTVYTGPRRFSSVLCACKHHIRQTWWTVGQRPKVHMKMMVNEKMKKKIKCLWGALLTTVSKAVCSSTLLRDDLWGA